MTEPLGSMRRFVGSVVVVTGAASGIGASTVERFLAEGANVAGCDLQAEALDTTFTHFNADPKRTLTHQLDVRDTSALTAFVDAAAERFGRIDVMVNNAGIGAFGHADEIEPAVWGAGDGGEPRSRSAR